VNPVAVTTGAAPDADELVELVVADAELDALDELLDELPHAATAPAANNPTKTTQIDLNLTVTPLSSRSCRPSPTP
jgi:hypothetical protein